MTPLAVSFADLNINLVIIGMAAWFISMGVHEGGHAFAANYFGDDTPRRDGTLTMNPFKHLGKGEPMRMVLGVVMPLITMISWGFPSGMAWVAVSPSNFRDPVRDHALVSFWGPGAELILALLTLATYVALYPVLRENSTPALHLLTMFLFYLYFVSVVYAVVSLVPIPPLDGSRVLYYFGNWRLREIMTRIEPYGWFIYIGLFFVLGAGRLLEPIYMAFMNIFVHLPEIVWGLR